MDVKHLELMVFDCYLVCIKTSSIADNCLQQLCFPFLTLQLLNECVLGYLV